MVDVGERLENLEKAIEQIGNSVAGSEAGIGDHRISNDSGLAAFSYFEGQSSGLTSLEKSLLKRMAGKPGSRLPEGYRPQFKSFSHFLRGVAGKDEKFEAMHKSSIAQLSKSVDSHSTLESDSLGMLVLPEFAPDIAEVMYNEDDLLGLTDQYTISGNRISFPRVPSRSRQTGKRHGGIVGNWLDEGDAVTPSRARLESTEFRLKKLGVVIFLNEELLEDSSYAIEQWVTRAVRREISFMCGDSIVRGKGGGRPLGYLESGAAVVVTPETGQAANTVVAENILKMYSHRRAEANLGEYEWHINQNVEPQLHQMTLGTAGSQQVVYMPPGGLSAAPYATLMGLRVRVTEFNPSLGNKGDISLVRMKGYGTVSKGGINEVASQHVEFLREQTAIRFTLRMDGRPMTDSPTVPYQSSGDDAQSDFIVLGDRL